MNPQNKLNYSRKNTEKSKKFRSFIISFIAFVIVLGAISLLMFMKSLNFNLKNLLPSSEESTSENTLQQSTPGQNLTGGISVAVLCGNTDGDLSFAFLIKSDYEKMKAEVVYIPITLTASYSGVTSSLNDHFKNSGVDSYVQAFEDYSGIDIDKYIFVNEVQFKNFMAKFKDVTVDIPQDINGGNSVGLILNKGPQNLTSDLLLKYIKYADNFEKTKAFCNMLSVVFEQKNSESLDKLFSYLANNSQTDISIIDFTDEKENINAFMSAQGEFIPIETLSQVIEGTK